MDKDCLLLVTQAKGLIKIIFKFKAENHPFEGGHNIMHEDDFLHME